MLPTAEEQQRVRDGRKSAALEALRTRTSSVSVLRADGSAPSFNNVNDVTRGQDKARNRISEVGVLTKSAKWRESSRAEATQGKSGDGE